MAMPAWLQVLVVLASALNSILLLVEYVSMRSLVARTEHVKLCERVTRLEEADRAGPGWTLVNQLRSELAGVGGDVKQLSARIDGMQQLLQRNESALETLQRHILKVEG